MPGDLFAAYVAGTAGALYDGWFASAGDRRRAVARAATRPLASEVAAALAAQNARLAPSAARDAHLAALRDGAVAVVTGQQVGLFLGPLFTVYKAASAVRVARALAAESGRAVVPIFWLQTEDHDLPEIASCTLPGADGLPRRLALPADPGERISIAHRTLPDDVAACLAALAQMLGPSPHAAAHVDRLARHYRPGVGWGAAFAGILSELFADDGLVLVDPRDPALAAVAAPVHRRALTDAASLADALVARTRALEAAGYAAAVHVRPGAPLSFVHPDGRAGPRRRLVPAPGDRFVEVGAEVAHGVDAVLRALESEPLSCSTSALLRPILQDTLLPTAAVVAGPGEVAYFAQLAPLYAAFGLPAPLVVPRARCRVVDAATDRLLARLDLRPEDLARPLDTLRAAANAARDPAEPDGRAVAAALCAAFDAALGDVRERVVAAGPGLDTAIEKTRATVAAAVARLGGKLDAARLHADTGLVRDLRRAQALLFPAGVPQERVYGLAWFAARWGDRAFVRGVVDAVVPFDATPLELHDDAFRAGDATVAT